MQLSITDNWFSTCIPFKPMAIVSLRILMVIPKTSGKLAQFKVHYHNHGLGAFCPLCKKMFDHVDNKLEKLNALTMGRFKFKRLKA